MRKPLTPCRQPFAHNPETCTCEPEPASVAVRNAELNAAIRDWQDKTFGWKLLAVFLATDAAGFDGKCQKLCPDGSLQEIGACQGEGVEGPVGRVKDASQVCVQACASG